MPAKRICRLSPAEAYALEIYGTKPDCRKHLHCSLREATEIAGTEYGPERQVDNGRQLSWPRQRRSGRFVGNALVMEHMPTPTVIGSFSFPQVQWRIDKATTAKMLGPRPTPESNGWPHRMTLGNRSTVAE